MCLAVPVKLVEVNGDRGVVQFPGMCREVGLQLLEEPAVGDYVLVHAGFALQRLDPDEARKTLDILGEMAALREEEFNSNDR